MLLLISMKHYNLFKKIGIPHIRLNFQTCLTDRLSNVHVTAQKQFLRK